MKSSPQPKEIGPEDDLLAAIVGVLGSIRLGVVIWECEVAGEAASLRMRYANTMASMAGGADFSEFVGQRIFESFPALRDTEQPDVYMRALRTGRTELLPDIVYGDESIPEAEWSISALPIEGRFLGVIFENVTHRRMASSALRKADEMKIRLKERREFEQRLEHQATHDPLTGLPNRTLLADRIDGALKRTARHGGAVGLLFLDLDQFKLVNDTRGHESGDRLLVEVASRFQGVVRDCDTLGRYGGDEFVILVEGDIDVDGVMRVAERIRSALREPIDIGGKQVHTTASIGLAIANDGEPDAPMLLGNADGAMYQAKRAGRDRIEVFDETLKACTLERIKVEADLRRALEQNELRVFYQPIIQTDSGHVNGFEALVRWQHPERGLLTPDNFIPIAEETEMIVDLDRWVLHAACSQLRSWDDHQKDRLEINVNLSARQLTDPNLPAFVRDTLRATELDPDRLCLEVTETALLEFPERVALNVQKLRQLDVKVALDDFGTGYSSLSHLQNLPLTDIKIDRSFISGLGLRSKESAIIRSITSLARDLDLRTTAEGIETQEQCELLSMYGPELAQGYLFARPLPPNEAAFSANLTSPRTALDPARGS